MKYVNGDSIAHLAQRESELWNQGYGIVAVASRSDGYMFYLVATTNRQRRKFYVFAGCHDRWSLARYRRHAKTNYNYLGKRKDANKRRETLAILDLFEKTVRARHRWF